MRVETVPVRELDATLLQVWRGMQTHNPLLASPYFCVEFARCVGEVRDDAFVAICEEAGKIVAFLPFQRGFGYVGRPLGGPMSDYQGLIAAEGVELDPRELLKGARLSMWMFDHLLAEQHMFAPFETCRERSFVLDLSRGFQHYAEVQRRSGSEQLAVIRRKAKKLAREVGPLRYEPRVKDPAVLERVLAWKTEQSERTGSERLFQHRWARELIERIFATEREDFAGMLSALWAGDTLVAAHMGMRSRSVLHYWFPSYDRLFAKYVPGLTLLLDMAESAPAMGLSAIDLGKGEQRYKLQLSTREVPLSEGFVSLLPYAREAAEFADMSAAFIRKTPLVAPARIPARLLRRARAWASYR